MGVNMGMNRQTVTYGNGRTHPSVNMGSSRDSHTPVP